MKIICIGRNYADHAKELGNEVPEEPLFFLKPDSAILPHRNPLYIPEFTKDLHYEVELVVKIDRLGKYISPEHAPRYYSSIGLGIDFTARDLQKKLKEKGQPWEKAKAFDGSAALSKRFIPLEDFDDPGAINFSLKKNGDSVQEGNSRDMIFDINQIISFVSKFMTLKIGDLIYTGTPPGVGKVAIDDVLEGYIQKEQLLKVRIK